MTSTGLYISSVVLGAIGGWIIARIGGRLGLLDHSNERSSHEGIVPKGGGIGILAAFVFACLFLIMPLAFLLPAAVLALFSLLGDKFEISPKYRLPVQFLTTLFFLIFTHSSLSSPFFLSQYVFSPLSSLIYFFFLSVFIVGTANWYNFMDGINGIAGITAIVGFGMLAFFIYISEGGNKFTVLSICITLSCLGFLPFNFPNAKVFMGDVGSILLGFVFACTVVMVSKSLLEFICLASFIFTFYVDEIITMIIRIKDGKSLLKPHRMHLYQFFANEMGIAHWKVSVGYGIVQLIIGVSVLLIKPFGLLSVLFLLIAVFVGFVWVNFFVRRRIARSY